MLLFYCKIFKTNFKTNFKTFFIIQADENFINVLKFNFKEISNELSAFRVAARCMSKAFVIFYN